MGQRTLVELLGLSRWCCGLTPLIRFTTGFHFQGDDESCPLFLGLWLTRLRGAHTNLPWSLVFKFALSLAVLWIGTRHSPNSLHPVKSLGVWEVDGMLEVSPIQKIEIQGLVIVGSGECKTTNSLSKNKKVWARTMSAN